jgi:hypothetical protein
VVEEEVQSLWGIDDEVEKGEEGGSGDIFVW